VRSRSSETVERLIAAVDRLAAEAAARERCTYSVEAPWRDAPIELHARARL